MEIVGLENVWSGFGCHLSQIHELVCFSLQMVSFLGFVEKVLVDHTNLNSMGPHLSALLLYMGSLMKDF